ncbi:NHLP family bacteriocin export ABC transporter peptidase/permease/ATPase subunit [Methanospirillum hungatei]|uniref:NHLP family bacteriocin export ABC transporter peptidase/permease/ATPase subunit n=1 Tax=Methanospirillum hungatei TaxID=2203 RepID=UPI0026EA69DF|nr:NHLP family bacteriocin export ABC transporter peptidase/permease/ATPase subunit [Methanospirillum hungatei]MCA1916238.1 NHLP family bacteriocin export ABC transporter peptidase/permease/ATPase subunit [Methanospirillum hungatei]
MAFLSKKVKTPFVLQMEAAECGAVSLAIILGYYGLFLPLEKIREDCGISRDGSRAINVIQAARKYGMDAAGYRVEPENLKDIKMPVIIHWNFSHFMVLEGFGRGKVYVNDPASGRRTISFEEFDNSFTGIVLSIHPGPDFKSGGVRTTFWNMLLPKMKPEILPLLFLLIAGIAMLIPGIALPIANQVFLDQIVLADRQGLLLPLLQYISFFVLLQVFINWIREICVIRWEANLSYKLSHTFFHKILSLPISFFDQRYTGEISSRVSINEHIASIICSKGAPAVLDIIISFVYLGLLFSLNALLTLIACFVSLGNLLFFRYISDKRVELSRKIILARGRLTGVAFSGIQMIESLKSSGQESEFFEKWSGYHAGYINTMRDVKIASSLMNIVPSFISGIGTTILLAAGSYLILQGSISIGFFFAYQTLLVNFLQPTQRLMNVGGDLSDLDGSLQRLIDVEQYFAKEQKREVSLSEFASDGNFSKMVGDIRFEEVTFGYNPREPPILHNISFHCMPGKRIAFVGPSGCGKSTIAKLAAGFYTPWEGRITIDGRDLNEIPHHVRHVSIAYVSQEIFIFEDTVLHNITLWDKTLSQSSIIQAAKDAEIDEFISGLEGGYEHNIEDGGRNVSGGQRQRLEIARALAKNPSLLIMDEATSALDPVTEKNIESHIRQRGCSCLIIAHRLSTVRDCDWIIVLDKGYIVEQGTHEQLMELKGSYYRLISADDSSLEGGE